MQHLLFDVRVWQFLSAKSPIYGVTFMLGSLLSMSFTELCVRSAPPYLRPGAAFNNKAENGSCLIADVLVCTALQRTETVVLRGRMAKVRCKDGAACMALRLCCINCTA